MNGTALGSIVEQKDLVVQIYNYLKVASRVDRVVKTALGTLAFISRN